MTSITTTTCFFQPIPLFPRPNFQLIRFIRTKLNPLQCNVFDWIIDHMSIDNRVFCQCKDTIVKLLMNEFQQAKTHICAALRQLIKLDIIRKESSQKYVVNPYIVNRVAMIPSHAFGFAEKKLKVLEAAGWRAWKDCDDKQKQKIPSSRIRLQAAKFRAIKDAHTIKSEETDMQVVALAKIENLERQLADVHDLLKKILHKVEVPKEVKDEVKLHLKLVKSE